MPSESSFDRQALRRRRFRITLFFARTVIHFLWFDFFLRLSPFRVFRPPWVPRWRNLASRYKQVAVDAQGLWVKLGQFLSTRVDLLPMEITQELESLRDEIPPVSQAVIIEQIENGLGRAIGDVFSWLAPVPIGSASLAQVHRARTTAGEPVVVKVLRPGIRETIAADMKLLRRMSFWLKSAKPITRRADIDAIMEEFATVTTKELDLRLEARNAERFARDFAEDPGLAAPRIYNERSASTVLTMEDVSYIRIDDVEELQAAGIDRKAVARKVYDVFLTQFFITYRVHADPHPGNLFVRPLPTLEEIAEHPLGWSGFRPGDPIPYVEQRPFQLVLVDFGMVVEVPATLREGLREFAIALGTRDARRVLDSYSKLGVLQKGADLERIEEMLQAQLDDFWGTFIGQMRASDFSGPEAQAFLEKYEGLMASAPFQFRTEMLFVTRAMGILSGLTYSLDPDFDAWNETAPFAQRLVREDITKAVFRTVSDLAAGRAPSSLNTLLRLLPTNRSGQLRPVVADRHEAEDVRRLRRSVNRLTSIVMAGGLLIVGVALKERGVQLSQITSWLWPRNDLGQWIIEIACVALVVTFLRRSS
jgi:predicted unusual protein kinase regulating ubiquinone biosynthesis (AarF/ABC1/UbiB family)